MTSINQNQVQQQVGSDAEPPSFKEQLDQAATDSRPKTDENPPNPIVEKITEYVPAAAQFLGNPKEEEEQKVVKPADGIPPERPDHDHKIEDFVRDQHRSKAEDGELLIAKEEA